MKAKLIKSDIQYRLHNEEGIVIATSLENGKLSIKNCQAIENGYDLEELACDKIGIDISVLKHIDSKLESHSSPCVPLNEGGCVGAGLYHMVKGFEIGFQKALEILGDKKFSKDSLIDFYIDKTGYGMDMWSKEENSTMSIVAEYIESLQQTEWDVEIEWEKDTELFNICPKLDANGCLILKRI